METTTVIFTTAPKGYDWRWTTEEKEVAGINLRGTVVRKVRIEKKHAVDQIGRYLSGLHMAANEEEWHKLVCFGLVTETDANREDMLASRGETD